MSRVYRIHIAGTVRESRAGRRTLAPPEFVPRERGAELIAAALERRGFVRRGDGRLERRSPRMNEVFDPDTLQVTATAEGEREYERSEVGDLPFDEREMVAREERALSRDLDAVLDDPRDLHEAVAEAQGEALVEKAATLGDVTRAESGWDPGGEFTLVLTVKT